MTDDVSFFSRFTVKFAEITAAGIATAVSGYLIAHVGGLLSAPAVTPVALPAAVQTAPMWSSVTGSLRAPPVPPVSADAGEERLAPQPDVRSPVQPERPVVNATQAAPLRKTVTADTGAAEAKPHEMESIEAKVRAALAKADANRPAPHAVSSHQTDSPADVAARLSAVEAQPRSIEPPTASIATAPRAAEAVPQPAPPVAAQAGPLTTVDIQSRPIAGVAIAPSPSGEDTAQVSVQASAQENTEASHHGLFPDLFAPFKKLPHLLRDDPPEPADQAPRPPMPVGQ